MQEYLTKVESWISQVRDDNVEDYDFLDDIVKKGDGNLANIGTYLAVYENLNDLVTDGKGVVATQSYPDAIDTDLDLYVDDELLKSLDERKTEFAREKSDNPARIQERTKHRETVYGKISAEDRKRVRAGEITFEELRNEGRTEENGLLDGSFGGKETGHEFIYHMLDEFRENADYEDSSSPNSYTKDKSNGKTPQKPQGQETEGGENIMTKEAYQYTQEIDDVFDELGNAINRSDSDTARRAATEVESLIYDLTEDLEATEEGFQKYDEKMRDYMSGWLDQLDDYRLQMKQRNISAHEAARTLMGVQRELEGYELDERTETLIDVADKL